MSHPPNSQIRSDHRTPEAYDLQNLTDGLLCEFIALDPYSEGAHRAFAELYDRHYLAVFGYLSRLARKHRAFVSDLSQQAWTKIARFLANAMNKPAERRNLPRNFAAWGKTIAKNCFRDFLKVQGRCDKREGNCEPGQLVSQYTFDIAEGADQAILDSSILYDEDINAVRIRDPLLRDALLHLEDHQRYAFVEFALGEELEDIAAGARERFGQTWDESYVHRLIDEARSNLGASLANHPRSRA